MKRSNWFVVGDLTTSAVAGLVAGGFAWWLIDTHDNMLVAMLLGMFIPMFLIMPIALLLGRIYGAMETMLIMMFSAMLSGMVVAMVVAMNGMTILNVAWVSLLVSWLSYSYVFLIDRYKKRGK